MTKVIELEGPVRVRILRLPEVQRRTGLSRSTIYVRLDRVSMGIENGTLPGIENGTLRDGPCGGSVATGAGAVPEWRRLTIPPPSGLSRRPPPWTPWGGWPSTAPCASASGSCCRGC